MCTLFARELEYFFAEVSVQELALAVFSFFQSVLCAVDVCLLMVK